MQVSIHAPREGSDDGRASMCLLTLSFNPRSPRRERRAIPVYSPARSCVSIHAPREGSDLCRPRLTAAIAVSIHAPREGSDYKSCNRCLMRVRFNPRSPRRERPGTLADYAGCTGFNPRSPRRERPTTSMMSPIPSAFQSTLPAKGATSGVTAARQCRQVSIHAPREGSDIHSGR